MHILTCKKNHKKHQALIIKAMLPLQYNASRSGYGVVSFRVVAVRFFRLLTLSCYASRSGYDVFCPLLLPRFFHFSLLSMYIMGKCTGALTLQELVPGKYATGLSTKRGFLNFDDNVKSLGTSLIPDYPKLH
jgi:hypothetical protein